MSHSSSWEMNLSFSESLVRSIAFRRDSSRSTMVDVLLHRILFTSLKFFQPAGIDSSIWTIVHKFCYNFSSRLERDVLHFFNEYFPVVWKGMFFTFSMSIASSLDPFHGIILLFSVIFQNLRLQSGFDHFSLESLFKISSGFNVGFKSLLNLKYFCNW